MGAPVGAGVATLPAVGGPDETDIRRITGSLPAVRP